MNTKSNPLPHAVTLTFGRNIGDGPMSSFGWKNFQKDVQKSFETIFANRVDFIDTHFGIGYWDGRSEESCKMTAIVDGEPTAPDRVKLLAHITNLCTYYEQDAIVLSIGQNFLVTPS